MNKMQEEIDKIRKNLKEFKDFLDLCEIEAQSERQKDWPDSLVEARARNPVWGFEIDNERYMVLTHSASDDAEGLAVNPSGCWTDVDDMKQYWKGDGVDDHHYQYRFVKFDTAADLYCWLLEGEEE